MKQLQRWSAGLCLAVTAVLMTPGAYAQDTGNMLTKQMANIEQWTQSIDQKYSQIVAQLERIIEVGKEHGNADMVARAESLLTKAKGHYEQLMGSAQSKLADLQGQLEKVGDVSNLGVGDVLPGAKETVDNALPQDKWQGAGDPLGKTPEAGAIDRQVDTGMKREQIQGEMKGVDRAAYEAQSVGNDGALEEALKESDSMP